MKASVRFIVIVAVALLMLALVIGTIIFAYMLTDRRWKERFWRFIGSACLLKVDEEKNAGNRNVDIERPLEKELDHFVESEETSREEPRAEMTSKHCSGLNTNHKDTGVTVDNPAWDPKAATRTKVCSANMLQEQQQKRKQQRLQHLFQSRYRENPSAARTTLEPKTRKRPQPQYLTWEKKPSKVAKASPNIKTTDVPRVLAEILDAQNGGLLYYPEYEVALEEIRNGAKLSCWMWYIWPSMHGIRSHRMPNLLLPDFQSAIDYLRHDTLRRRLVKITKAAERALSLGQSTTRLFGGELDSTKVHESCTIFALAAISIGCKEYVHLFVRIVQVYFGEPNTTVMKFFQELSHKDNMSKALTYELRRIADIYHGSALVH